MLRLQLRDQPNNFVKLAYSSVTLGRDDSNDLVIDAESISDFHGEIISDAHRYFLVDLLSANGIFVNEQRVSGRCELAIWDIVRIGNVELQVIDPNKYRPGDWALRPVSSQVASQFHTLKAITLVGRGPECDLAIDSNLLSRHHARLFLDGQQLRVEDLGSSNGTFINGERIERAAAKPGDEIRFDQKVFIVVGPSGPKTEKCVVDDSHTILRSTIENSAALVEEETICVVPEVDVPVNEAICVAPEVDVPVNETVCVAPGVDAPVNETICVAPEVDVPVNEAICVAPEIDAPISDVPINDELGGGKTVFTPKAEMSVSTSTGSLRVESSNIENEQTRFTSSMEDGEATRYIGSEVAVSVRPSIDQAPRLLASLIEESNLLQHGSISLADNIYLLGRGKENNIVLNDTSVSKQHAKLSYQNGYWEIHDLVSRNGISINGAIIEQARLQDGDRIILGKAVFVFECVNAGLADNLLTEVYKLPSVDPEITSRLNTRKKSGEKTNTTGRKPIFPAWIYGAGVLAMAIVAATFLYFWRTGIVIS